MNLKTFVLAGLIASPLLAIAPAQVAQAQASFDLRVGTPPPPPRVIAPPPPRSGYVWAPGYYRWNGRRHVWVDGRWYRERPGYAWVEPRWEPGPGDYRFRRGYWERRR